MLNALNANYEKNSVALCTAIESKDVADHVGHEGRLVAMWLSQREELKRREISIASIFFFIS